LHCVFSFGLLRQDFLRVHHHFTFCIKRQVVW